MPSASAVANLKCSGCGRRLLRGGKIKCPRCKEEIDLLTKGGKWLCPKCPEHGHKPKTLTIDNKIKCPRCGRENNLEGAVVEKTQMILIWVRISRKKGIFHKENLYEVWEIPSCDCPSLTSPHVEASRIQMLDDSWGLSSRFATYSFPHALDSANWRINELEKEGFMGRIMLSVSLDHFPTDVRIKS
ncbi:MAG: hypothetical protein WC302_01040 [Candidatus Paceibacterota bacterium]|jgi:predicted RNA-binding Zn-ribbon protein involved in translation (DUF1610 family)